MLPSSSLLAFLLLQPFSAARISAESRTLPFNALRSNTLAPSKPRNTSATAPRTNRRLNSTTVKMVKTASTMLPLGTTAPNFSLVEPLTGNPVSLADVRMDNGLLVVFMCNHCPFVILLQDQLRALGADLKSMSVGMVGISSNDINAYPQDGPGPMANMAQTTFSTFPYLLDETQQVAKAYRAACTPDLYLFDKDLKLVYRGQADDARPGNGIPVTGKSIRHAVSLLLEGKTVPEESMWPSIGCNIKWTKGNEPDYFG